MTGMKGVAVVVERQERHILERGPTRFVACLDVQGEGWEESGMSCNHLVLITEPMGGGD